MFESGRSTATCFSCHKDHDLEMSELQRQLAVKRDGSMKSYHWPFRYGDDALVDELTRLKQEAGLARPHPEFPSKKETWLHGAVQHKPDGASFAPKAMTQFKVLEEEAEYEESEDERADGAEHEATADSDPSDDDDDDDEPEKKELLGPTQA